MIPCHFFGKSFHTKLRLHLAALNGHPDVLKVLLEHGAPCDVATATGKTPLHGAALYGHGSVARMLLEFKADKELDGWGGLWKIHQVRQYLCNVCIYIYYTYVCTHVSNILCNII